MKNKILIAALLIAASGCASQMRPLTHRLATGDPPRGPAQVQAVGEGCIRLWDYGTLTSKTYPVAAALFNNLADDVLINRSAAATIPSRTPSASPLPARPPVSPGVPGPISTSASVELPSSASASRTPGGERRRQRLTSS